MKQRDSYKGALQGKSVSPSSTLSNFAFYTNFLCEKDSFVSLILLKEQLMLLEYKTSMKYSFLFFEGVGQRDPNKAIT